MADAVHEAAREAGDTPAVAADMERYADCSALMATARERFGAVDILVNNVCTTPPTEQEQAWYRQVVDQTTASSFLKRYGTMGEQTAAILFLASNEASYITGVTLPVAGGDLG